MTTDFDDPDVGYVLQGSSQEHSLVLAGDPAAYHIEEVALGTRRAVSNRLDRLAAADEAARDEQELAEDDDCLVDD